MKKRIHPHGARVFVGLALCCFSVLSGGLSPSKVLAQGEQPIAYIGHGGFFDHRGNQIPLTQAFVEQAQAWYRKDMLTGLDTGRKKEFSRFEQRLQGGVKMEGQERLVMQQRTLEWLFANSPKYKDDDRTLGKLRALEYALSWRLPEQPGQDIDDKREEFKLNPKLTKKLEATQFKPDGGIKFRSATVNSGQAYINECMDAKVPIPPTINQMDPAGLTGWKSQGFIPPTEQFIGGTPAEVRTYKSTSPAGMCYALPRYSDATKTTVALDGVICLSQETSKACFWDNSRNGSSFSFPAGTRIPIGVPNTTIDPAGRYQAGGAELAIGNPGGVCTDCHAGENPYITHPKSNLGGGVLWESLSAAPQNLPTFAPNRFNPLVAASWPQNRFSQTGSTVPNVCKGCHTNGGAGRFPHLSNQLPGYCGTVLTKAYHQTMPIGSPGSQVAAGDAFKNAWCGAPPNMASADGVRTGDLLWQHINGQVHYWPMLNGQRQGGIDIFTPIGPEWKLVGAGDFNGDGTEDLLWQHINGQVHYWPMLNGQRQGGIDIFTPIGPEWKLVGAGDFNGDGTEDLLWQHINGQVHYWPMLNGQRQGGIDIFTPIGPEWKLIGAGDLNGN
jgi:hypothetical protein